MHVDLIVSYSKSIRQQQIGGTIICNNASLTCMTIIGPATGWFKIVKIPMFDLEEVTIGNDEYIDKSSAGVSQLLTTHLYADTHVHKKSCLTRVLSLNETSLLF